MITWNRIFFQSPSTIMIESIVILHDYVILFLFTIMLSIFLKFIFLKNSVHYRIEFFENHQVETIWTVIPFIILLAILIPSLTALYILDSCSFCGLTVIVTGHQWYWSYFMNNCNTDQFDSYMETLSSNPLRLIDTDNRVLIPTNLPIRFLTTSRDVIHSWTIPRLGFKIDAVPGRINQFCVATKKSGVYFGQCSEICGANHRFIPIVLESAKIELEI